MTCKTFIVSFRFEETEDAAERRRCLVERAHIESDCIVWEETPSLILMKSEKSAGQLAYHLYLHSGFRRDLDTLLVIDVETMTYATEGSVDYPATLGSFFRSGLLRMAG